MPSDSIKYFTLLIFSVTSCFTVAQSAPDISDSHKKIIEQQLLKPIRIIHDSSNFIGAFANAYTISSVWKYELYSKPTAKNKYYVFVLREYRGAFIIDQYTFKINSTDSKIEIEDWETGKFIEPQLWLKKYKMQKQKTKRQ